MRMLFIYLLLSLCSFGNNKEIMINIAVHDFLKHKSVEESSVFYLMTNDVTIEDTRCVEITFMPQKLECEQFFLTHEDTLETSIPSIDYITTLDKLFYWKSEKTKTNIEIYNTLKRFSFISTIDAPNQSYLLGIPGIHDFVKYWSYLFAIDSPTTFVKYQNKTMLIPKRAQRKILKIENLPIIENNRLFIERAIDDYARNKKGNKGGAYKIDIKEHTIDGIPFLELLFHRIDHNEDEKYSCDENGHLIEKCQINYLEKDESLFIWEEGEGKMTEETVNVLKKYNVLQQQPDIRLYYYCQAYKQIAHRREPVMYLFNRTNSYKFIKHKNDLNEPTRDLPTNIKRKAKIILCN